MQILVNNDFNSGGVQFTQAQIASFLRDEQTAISLLTATFTNNITLTFNVGFGSDSVAKVLLRRSMTRDSVDER
jgi:hypothetical protein